MVSSIFSRYEVLWLQLMKKIKKSKDREKLSPPLDIYWIWHVHMLNPTQYAGIQAILHPQ